MLYVITIKEQGVGDASLRAAFVAAYIAVLVAAAAVGLLLRRPAAAAAGLVL